MSSSVGVTIRQLSSNDVALMEAMMTTFGEAFDEVDIYTEARPSADYLERLLDSNHFIALTALKGGAVVGGLAAYELQKFERERSEIYIYDLAVATAHRREGIATALIEELKVIAAARGANVIFVQADRNDAAAIALHTKLSRAKMCYTLISRSPGDSDAPSPAAGQMERRVVARTRPWLFMRLLLRARTGNEG